MHIVRYLPSPAVLAASLAILTAPALARAEPPEVLPATTTPESTPLSSCPPGAAVPPGYRCALRPSEPAFRRVVITGGVTWGVGYVLSLGTIVANKGADPVAAVPIFGPFMAAATHTTIVVQQKNALGPTTYCTTCDHSPAIYIAAGTVQSLGAVVMLTSLAARKPVFEYVGDAGFSIRPTPYAGPRASGLALVGTF